MHWPLRYAPPPTYPAEWGRAGARGEGWPCLQLVVAGMLAHGCQCAGSGRPLNKSMPATDLRRGLLPARAPTRRAQSPLTPDCGCIHSSVCAYFRLALEEALSRTRAGRASSSPVMGPVFGTCTTVGSAPPSSGCHSPPPGTSCVAGQLSVQGFTSTPRCTSRECRAVQRASMRLLCSARRPAGHSTPPGRRPESACTAAAAGLEPVPHTEAPLKRPHRPPARLAPTPGRGAPPPCAGWQRAPQPDPAWPCRPPRLHQVGRVPVARQGGCPGTCKRLPAQPSACQLPDPPPSARLRVIKHVARARAAPWCFKRKALSMWHLL